MIEESRIETVGQIVCAGDDSDGDCTDTRKGHFYEDERLPLSFHKKRHITTISGDTAISKSWRIRDRVSRNASDKYFKSLSMYILTKNF